MKTRNDVVNSVNNGTLKSEMTAAINQMGQEVAKLYPQLSKDEIILLVNAAAIAYVETCAVTSDAYKG